MPRFEISNWIARNRNFSLGQNGVAPILSWGRSQLGAQQSYSEENIGIVDKELHCSIQICATSIIFNWQSYFNNDMTFFFFCSRTNGCIHNVYRSGD